MAGIIYLAVAVFFGSALCRCFFPGLSDMAEKDYQGRHLGISSLFVSVPAWIYSGLIPMTWCVYFLAYLLRNSGSSMRTANIIVITVFFIAGGLLYLRGIQKQKLQRLEWKAAYSDLIFLAAVLVLSVTLFWTTFRIQDGRLYVGLSVFSDFAPHLGMIRSFSTGNNFPTAYSHYAGEDIKYHFMFQFLTGNLEYLGIRLDYAFNIPSTLGFISTFSLLYVLAAKITGKKAAGYLAALFFAFRSSVSVFSYLAGIGKEESIIRTFFQNSSFIGYSTHEDWGLWNLNVYCNQRHLAFTLGILLLIVLAYVPRLYKMAGRITNIRSFFKENMFAIEGWRVENPAMAVAAGVLLGAIAFWNGAVTIAALLVLFILAAVSDNRLEFLITAAITVTLSILQSSFFIDGSAVSTSLYYGFIAENRTFFGVIDYIFRLTGFLPFVVAAAFVISDAKKRCLTLAFAAPFVFSFYVSLTPDVTVNHKYIMISLMLLGIMEAYAIAVLWEQKRILAKASAVFLTMLLTITGFFDYVTVLNRNQKENNLSFDVKDELTLWIQENSDAQDIFLTSNYALNNVVLGGAMLFNGWQYYAWSAGYDTALRDGLVKQMYEADNIELLKNLTAENNIRFIIVEYDNRTSSSYYVREDVIASAFKAVYTTGEDEWRTTIYDVKQPIN